MMTDKIKSLLTDTLQPSWLEVQDNSHAHAGHAGMESGGHYHVTIVADAFDGKNLVQRHQLIYQSLGDLMKKEIHALGIKAYTPLEFKK